MSSSSRSLDEGIAHVGQPRRPDPYISANNEQMAREEPGLVLPTSTEIQDAWEEVAGWERVPEVEENNEAQDNPVPEEEREAEEDAEAEVAHSTPPITGVTGASLQATITGDIDTLFSPQTINHIRAENNIQLDSDASKKRKASRGGVSEGGTTTTRARGKAPRGRSRNRG